MKRQQTILKNLSKFEQEIFEKWHNAVSPYIASNLSQNLLIRNEEFLLSLNFGESVS